MAVQPQNPTQDQIDRMYSQDDQLGIPRGTTQRQINQESRFDPQAKSAAGATGYAQVIPKTLDRVSAALGRTLDPTNFEDSMAIHGFVMSQNLRRFGNLPDALRGYNSGWDKAKWDNPETNGYVATVAGSNPETYAAPHVAPEPKLAPGEQDMAMRAKFNDAGVALNEALAKEMPARTEPASPDEAAAVDSSAAALARTTKHAGLGESIRESYFWDTLTGNLHQWTRQGEATPGWAMTSDQATNLSKNYPAVYNSDQLRQYVQGAVSNDDLAWRLSEAAKHADWMEREYNTGGLQGFANGAASLAVGIGDPVAWATTLGAGAVVNTARAGFLINAARSAAEMSAITAGNRALRNQDITGPEMIQQGLFGAAIHTAGHVLLGRGADGAEDAAHRLMQDRAETHLNDPLVPPATGDGTVGSALHEVPLPDQPIFHVRDESMLQTEGNVGRGETAYGAEADQPRLNSVRGELPEGGPAKVAEDLRTGSANDEAGVRRQEIAPVPTAEKPALPETPVHEIRAEELPPMHELSAPEHAVRTRMDPRDASVNGSGRSLKEMLEEVRTGPDKLANGLAGRLLVHLNDDLKVHHNPDLKGEAGVYFADTHSISLKRMDDTFTLLHEAAHALSAFKLDYGMKNPHTAHGRIYSEISEIREMVGMLHESQGGGDKKVAYYTKNNHEFVSGLFSGKTAFTDMLAGFDWHGIPVISRLFDAVRRLLGLDKGGEASALAKAMGLTEQLFNLPLNSTVRRSEGGDHMVFQEMDHSPESSLAAFKQTAAEQKWTQGIKEHVEVRGPASAAAKAYYESAARVKLASNSVAKLFDSVGNTLARSTSKGVRMVASMLAEDPSGMNRQHGMSATMDAERLKHSWRTPFMEVYGKSVPKLLSWKERVLYTLGQSGAAESRIGRQVAEYRLAKRNARLNKTEFAANGHHPEVAYLGDNLDAFWGHIHERAVEAGEPIGTALGGRGFQGHMPYRWHWADIHRASIDDPRKFDALVGNFRDQYVAKVVDPGIAEAVQKGGMDAASIAELRTMLTDKANALTENYVRQVMQDPKSRTAYETNHIAAITEDLLRNDFRGKKITNEVAEAVKQKISEISSDRTRTEFDLLRQKDGVSMLDFMDTDVGRMVDSSSQRFAGNISLARRGLGDPMQIGAMRNALIKDGASGADLENVDFLIRSLNGELNPNEAGAALIFRQLAYSSMMGKLGFNALADVAGTATAVGTSGMFKVLGRGFLKENGFMQSLRAFSPGTLAHDHRLFNQTVDHNVAAHTLVSEGSKLSNFAQKSSDWVSTLSLMRPVGKMLHNGFVPVFAEDLIKAIRTGKGMSEARLGDLGLTPERIEAIRTQLEAHDGSRSTGDALSWEKWDQLAADDLCGAIQRGTGQALQRMYVGETPKWTTETSFGKMMSQFKSYGWTAAEKQTMRNVFIKDGNSIAGFAVGLPLAMLMYRAKLEASMVGMSDGDKRKKVAQQFEENHGISALSGVMTMWNMSGMAADATDLASTLLVGQTHGTSSPAAALGYMASLKAGAGGLVSTAKGIATGDSAATQKGLYQSFRMVPGGNLPWVTPIVNSLKP